VIVENKVESDLRNLDMIKEGHFVLASGAHSKLFVRVKALPRELVDEYCLEFAKHYQGDGIDIVIGPATGAIILSDFTASHLSKLSGKPVLGLHAPKDDQGFILLHSKDVPILKGKRVLVVEDVTTTGRSMIRVIDLVRSRGSYVVGACVVVNRGNVSEAALDVRHLRSLLKLEIQTWPNENFCPLCQAKVVINTDVGRGKEFLARQT
jgi:orotate phosphoribosyltransferase